MATEKSIHLGDGAYATMESWGEVIVTANHHDPALATDKVHIDTRGMAVLIKWYNEVKDGD